MFNYFGFGKKMSQMQMYKYLFGGCMDFKKKNTKGEIDLDKTTRACNKYSVANTVKCWAAQWN